MEGIRQPTPHSAVYRHHGSEGFLHGKAGAQRLQPEMVLLIDHDARRPGEYQRRAAADRMLPIHARQLLAHQVTLVQQQSVGGRNLIQAEHHAVAQGRHDPYRLAYLLQYS